MFMFLIVFCVSMHDSIYEVTGNNLYEVNMVILILFFQNFHIKYQLNKLVINFAIIFNIKLMEIYENILISYLE